MKAQRIMIAFSFLLMCAVQPARCQPTVFSILQDREKQGDDQFSAGNFAAATESYEALSEDEPGNASIQIKLARTYYQVKDFKQAARAFENVASLKAELQPSDLLMMAESYMAIMKYDEAKKHLREYVAQEPGDNMAAKKLWRLDNLEFLYQDSAHFSVRPLSSINTSAAELCAVPVGSDIVFLSNRKGIRPVDQATSHASAPHFSLFFIPRKVDTILNTPRFTGEPEPFAPSIRSRFNSGPVAFYKNGKQMVFVASLPKADADGFRSLGLFFATRSGDEWILQSPYPHNSDSYSITDVAINEEGNALWFSSNMKGGKGGKDLYRSDLIDGRWSKPANPGEPINTGGDEAFPHLFRDATLYFSSNGHPGIGGLDIFKTAILKDGYSEPENIGYPVNSNGDDFGIVFDSGTTYGFFSSNRKGNGTDDDLYEFNMDMQNYPMGITGTLKFKEDRSSDINDLQPWPNVKLTLIDTWRNEDILETKTSDDGSFSFSIPYYSRYHILVTTTDGTVYMASLELQKDRNAHTDYEIVVIKDSFNQREKPKDDE
jgi:Tfp pilus assembly protein PilF